MHGTVVCQECTVADDVPSPAEDSLTITIGDRDCTCAVQLLSARDYGLSAILSFGLISYGVPAMSLT